MNKCVEGGASEAAPTVLPAQTETSNTTPAVAPKSAPSATGSALSWQEFQRCASKKALWPALLARAGKKGGPPKKALPCLEQAAGAGSLPTAHISLLYRVQKTSDGTALGWNTFQAAVAKKGLSRGEIRVLYYVHKELSVAPKH
eukprot:1534103-Prymnesium_polylepis.2